MGRKKCYCILTGIFFLLLSEFMYAQIKWKKYAYNPILTSTQNHFDARGIGSPDVFYENDTFYMVYAAGSRDTKGYIVLIHSTDGKTWPVPDSTRIILAPSSNGHWDSHFLDTPSLLRDRENFKMYYFGDSDNNPLNSAIGLAVSPDGTHWEKWTDNPILRPGNQGEWDELYIESPEVIYDGEKYLMYYSGVDATFRVRIGVATSTDGYHWTKYHGNPIITEGIPSQWDDFSVATPTVIFHDSIYEMWYCGASTRDFSDNGQIDTIKVGYAFSYDGLNWKKSNLNPVLHTFSQPYQNFERRGPWAPSVQYLSSGKEYLMWYETAFGFGLAEGINNHKNLFVFPNPVRGSFYVYMAYKGRLEIVDLTGKKLYQKTYASGGVHFIQHFFKPGIYLLITTDHSSGFNVYKFIVQ